jgi:hypothetical protein
MGSGKTIYLLIDEVGEDVSKEIPNYCRPSKGQDDLTEDEKRSGCRSRKATLNHRLLSFIKV